jgi:hypothetical protein
MTSQRPDQPASDPSAEPPERSVDDVLWGRVRRKRDRIRAEVHRNRRGGHRIPTWALTAVLVALLLGWLCLIVAS